MKKPTATTLFVGAFSLLTTLTALAAVPEVGTVIEGHSVPGAALGDAREQAEASYGEPNYCQSGATPGDAASCTWILEDYVGQGGAVQSQVTLSFRGPDGGGAGNRPDDVVSGIGWYGMDGWSTADGVNTLFAVENQDAVIALYPDAVLVNSSLFNTYLTAYEEGFSVWWSTEYLTGFTSVRMSVFEPRDPPPPREPSVSVPEISLDLDKRQVLGAVRVKNDLNWNVPGAEVYATWTLPDGSSWTVQGTTDSFGLARFVIDRARKGTYTLTIDDVVLEDHPFDIDNSVLSASIFKPR